jgi:hypothetical protein
MIALFCSLADDKCTIHTGQPFVVTDHTWHVFNLRKTKIGNRSYPISQTRQFWRLLFDPIDGITPKRNKIGSKNIQRRPLKVRMVIYRLLGNLPSWSSNPPSALKNGPVSRRNFMHEHVTVIYASSTSLSNSLYCRLWATSGLSYANQRYEHL